HWWETFKTELRPVLQTLATPCSEGDVPCSQLPHLNIPFPLLESSLSGYIEQESVLQYITHRTQVRGETQRICARMKIADIKTSQ
ncbi:hypothetical protein E3U43_011823, partial [Larimichthys crocea]